VLVSEEVDKYITDWTGNFTGSKKSVVLFPRSTEHVQHITKFCDENLISITPQGGNTGLVGGSVPMAGDVGSVVISLNRMKKLVDITVEDGTGILIAEGGCVLEILEAEANKRGYSMPLDLGSKGTCQIGGNVASNAGGLRFVKFGSLHRNVLGLEVVSASGAVIDLMRGRNLPKDNCGYHLKSLFIGSEGTLGIITKVAIALVPLPTDTCVVLLKVKKILHNLLLQL
jgi:D-2-hydroxyglutarate dehydrogenase